MVCKDHVQWIENKSEQGYTALYNIYPPEIIIVDTHRLWAEPKQKRQFSFMFHCHLPEASNLYDFFNLIWSRKIFQETTFWNQQVES